MCILWVLTLDTGSAQLIILSSYHSPMMAQNRPITTPLLTIVYLCVCSALTLLAPIEMYIVFVHSNSTLFVLFVLFVLFHIRFVRMLDFILLVFSYFPLHSTLHYCFTEDASFSLVSFFSIKVAFPIDCDIGCAVERIWLS